MIGYSRSFFANCELVYSMNRAGGADMQKFHAIQWTNHHDNILQLTYLSLQKQPICQSLQYGKYKWQVSKNVSTLNHPHQNTS